MFRTGDRIRNLSDDGIGLTVGAEYIVNYRDDGYVGLIDDDGDHRSRNSSEYELVAEGARYRAIQIIETGTPMTKAEAVRFAEARAAAEPGTKILVAEILDGRVYAAAVSVAAAPL